MWPLAILHALGSGTDAGRSWGLGIVVTCIALVGAAGGWRLWAGRRVEPAPARPLPETAGQMTETAGQMTGTGVR